MKYTLLTALSGMNNSILTAFFVGTLGIRDASRMDLVRELAAMKRRYFETGGIVSLENIRDVYTRLCAMAPTLSSGDGVEIEDVR